MKGKFCHNNAFRSVCVCVCETCLMCLRLWLTPEHLSSDQDASLDPSILNADTLATVPQSPCLGRILPSYSLWDGCAGLGFGLDCGCELCARGARPVCSARSWRVQAGHHPPTFPACFATRTRAHQWLFIGPVLSSSLPQAWEYLYNYITLLIIYVY